MSDLNDLPPTQLDNDQIIMKYLKDAFKSTFNAYFLGAVAIIPKDALPCIIVQGTESNSTIGPTSADDRQEKILIHIMADARTGFGAPDDDNTIMRQLRQIVQGIDPATRTYLPNTVLGALRTNLTLGKQIINSDIDVNYDITRRSDQPTLVEAVIVVTISDRVYIPNRN